MLEYLLWAPDRETFVATMTKVALPNGLGTVASLDEAGNLVPNPLVLLDEIGPVVSTPAVLDADRNVITPAALVEGHHVNAVALGPLAEALTAGLPQQNPDGSPAGLFERTRILAFLGEMNLEPTTDGVPAGYQGKSGVRIFDPATVKARVRVWQ